MNSFLIIYLVILGLFCGCIFRAINLMGSDFSFKKYCPSHVGNKKLNPKGFQWFNYLFIACGISFLPHLTFLYLKFANLSPVLAIITFILCIFACVGMIGVGYFSEERQYHLHFTFGTLFFGSFSFAMIFTAVILLIELIKKTFWPSLSQFLFVYIPIVICTGYLLIKLAKNRGILSQLFLEEWFFLVMILYWNLGMLIIV